MEDLQVAAMSAQLAERIGRRRFDLWFKSEAQLSVEASCLTIRAASQFVLEWLRKHLGADIRACWEGIVGQVGSVVFDVGAVCAEERPARSAGAPGGVGKGGGEKGAARGGEGGGAGGGGRGGGGG